MNKQRLRDIGRANALVTEAVESELQELADGLDSFGG